MQCRLQRDAERWRVDIDRALQAPAAQDWRRAHPFAASCPLRKEAHAQWYGAAGVLPKVRHSAPQRFVDGRAYFEHLAHVLECAREEIMIGGWFITAELFLKRPARGPDDPWQLLNLLRRKADQGVHVFVLFYKDFEQVSDNGSAWAHRLLRQLSPRIHVSDWPLSTYVATTLPQTGRPPPRPALRVGAPREDRHRGPERGVRRRHRRLVRPLGRPHAQASRLTAVAAKVLERTLARLTDLPGQNVRDGRILPPGEQPSCLLSGPQLVTRVELDAQGSALAVVPELGQLAGAAADAQPGASPTPGGEDDVRLDSWRTAHRTRLGAQIVEFMEGDKRRGIRARLDTPPKHLRDRWKRVRLGPVAI